MATASRSAKAQRSRKPRSHASKRRAPGDTTDGCTYSVHWTLLASTKGFTQVWVPTKAYDRVAARFLKSANGSYARRLLRERMAPLGVDVKCGGSCYGGFCEEHLIFDGGSSKVYVCECGYYV